MLFYASYLCTTLSNLISLHVLSGKVMTFGYADSSVCCLSVFVTYVCWLGRAELWGPQLQTLIWAALSLPGDDDLNDCIK